MALQCPPGGPLRLISTFRPTSPNRPHLVPVYSGRYRRGNRAQVSFLVFIVHTQSFRPGCYLPFNGHFFKNKFIYLFLFLAVLGLCCCARAFSSCGELGYSLLWCMGFSLRWLLLLWSTGSRRVGFGSCGSRVLEHRLSSCGARA